MCRKFVLLGLLVTFLALGTIAQADYFEDDFNTPHDYLVDGILGTEWSGFIGAGEGEAVDLLNADMNNAPRDANLTGYLYMQTTNGNWDSANPRGPLLYKMVSGDFVAEVNVVDIACCYGAPWVGHNTSGIMARVPNLSDAGDGEDHITMEYFSAWCGHMGRSINNGAKTEIGCSGGLCNNERYIQLSRAGDTFYFKTSTDGITWQWLADDQATGTYERTDMAGLALQVGLMNSIYSAETGYVAFDDFKLEADAFPPQPYASSPIPGDGEQDVSIYTNLRWRPGDYVKDVSGHELYVSTDFNDVNDSNSAVKVVLTNAVYTPPGGNFAPGATYYWAVDEVNDACAPYKWEGEVWSFATEGKATDPDPYHTQGNIPVEIPELKWTQTPLAVTQNFYFGTDEETVANSVTPLVSDIANDVNVVDISVIGSIQPLEPAVTYYWRIESVCGALGTSKGDVWSFLTAFPFHICDYFTEDHDYFAGVEGTIWDGVIGVEEYCIQITTDPYDPEPNDALLIESIDSYWDWRSGVLLYKDVVGDFSARILISDFQGLYTPDHTDEVPTNNAGIMARVSDVDLAGAGEDWLSMDFFPGWDCGNIVRNCNNGFRAEPGNELTGWDGDRWVQIERYDNKFVLSHSPADDGVTYNLSPASPIFREDMDGLPVQVGPHHAVFGGTQAYVEYDNFCLDRNAVEKAYAPNPAGGGYLDPMVGILSWTEGDFAVLHNVWFSTEFNDVNERKPAADRDTDKPVDEDGGRWSYDAGGYETLTIGQSYYWCIDEINDPCVWPGDVWRFTVQDYHLIDNFVSYSGTGSDSPVTGTLRGLWVDGNCSWDLYGGIATSGSLVQLNTDDHDGTPTWELYQPDDIAQSVGKSMKFYYDNDGSVSWEYDLYSCYPQSACSYVPSPDKYLSEAYAATDDDAADIGYDSLGMKRDWSSYKVLKLSFYGFEGNDEEPMYIGLEDDDGTLVAIPYNGDSSDVLEEWWHDWYVALSEFTDKDAGLALAEIIRIYIGFGDKDSPSAGGWGIVFFDDIQLFATGQCLPDSVIGDFDDDCVVGYRDLELFSYNFPGETPSLPTPIIQLVATGTVGADVTSWTNTGSLGGTFTDVNATDANNPVVGEILGKKCVTFDDVANALVWDQNAPATLTSDTNEPNDYTVIYEVYNPSIANEEYVFNWAVRGGPVRTCAGVGYGTNAEFGCIIHWDPPGDMGFDAGVPAAGQWHVIAATYDGTTNAVIVDGLVHSTEDKDLLVRMDQPVTVGAPYAIPGDPNTAYILGTYVPSYTNFRFTGSVASIRVYAEAVPPGDLAIVTAGLAGLPRAEADLKPDSKIDFGDLAVLGNKWMQAPELLE